MSSRTCPDCGRLPHPGECIGEIASDCSAADGGQSDAEALAGDPKRSADRLRKIRELVDQAEHAMRRQSFLKTYHCFREIREICSHESSSPSDAA